MAEGNYLRSCTSFQRETPVSADICERSELSGAGPRVPGSGNESQRERSGRPSMTRNARRGRSSGAMARREGPLADAEACLHRLQQFHLKQFYGMLSFNMTIGFT